MHEAALLYGKRFVEQVQFCRRFENCTTNVFQVLGGSCVRRHECQQMETFLLCSALMVRQRTLDYEGKM